MPSRLGSLSGGTAWEEGAHPQGFTTISVYRLYLGLNLTDTPQHKANAAICLITEGLMKAFPVVDWKSSSDASP